MVAKVSTGDISESALLVRLSRSIWGAHAKDKEASQLAAKSNHASDDAVNAWIALAPKEALTGVRSAQRACWAIWMRYTLPWRDDGKRILPSVLFSKYSEEMRHAMDGADDAADIFVRDVWPDVVKHARSRLGDFLDRHPLPTAQQLRSKMRVTQSFDTINDPKDWRTKGLSKKQVDEIRKEMTESLNETLDQAAKSVLFELREMVKKFAAKTRSSDAIFRDTLVGNIKRLTDIMPSLNITGDTDVEKVRQECETGLSKLDPQELRDDPVKRKKANAAATDILKHINEIIGPERSMLKS